MQSLNVHVLRQFAMEREAQLRRTTIVEGPIRLWPVRRWLGEELVRLGAWVAAEPMLRPAREGLR